MLHRDRGERIRSTRVRSDSATFISHFMSAQSPDQKFQLSTQFKRVCAMTLITCTNYMWNSYTLGLLFIILAMRSKGAKLAHFRASQLTEWDVVEKQCRAGLPAMDERLVDTGAAAMASMGPMAIPTSAVPKAAKSFKPSPQNSTVCCRPCSHSPHPHSECTQTENTSDKHATMQGVPDQLHDIVQQPH